LEIVLHDFSLWLANTVAASARNIVLGGCADFVTMEAVPASPPASTILTVTLNFALDLTYNVDRVSWHGVNRVASVVERAGGKGVNVARVLHALGHRASVAGLVGGRTGEAARAELRGAGLHDVLVAIRGQSRRTVAVVDAASGDATGLWEPGPVVTAAEWRAFISAYRQQLRGADAVVLSGSLPAGVPPDAYRMLCELAADEGVPAVLDADGDALRLGLDGRPTLVKPNVDELSRVTRTADPIEGAQALRAAGATAVVVSRGAEGLLAVAPEGSWTATPPERIAGNPTGAGDAAVAALVAGMALGTSWPERLADAAALSAAAVAAPLAGSFDANAYGRCLPEIDVRPIDPPPSREDRSRCP
jgi:tagatose 6-phosphate kinase